jgi:HAD superfamily hydrolase (TIGR01509 family)
VGTELDTVVFDIGNVLIAWDPRHLYRKVFETEAEMERFLGEVCTLDWHLAHDYGVPFEENAAKLKAVHPDHAELIDMWQGRYAEMIPGRIPGTVDLLHQLGDSGVTLHGLTNMPSDIFIFLRDAYPELQRFETTVVSGDEGVIKPDPRIFEILIERSGLTPERALFIDDSRRNVDAAAALGFRAHHFENAEALRADLVSLGLIG